MIDHCASCALKGRPCPTPALGLAMHGLAWDCAFHVYPRAEQTSMELDAFAHPWKDDDDARSYCGDRKGGGE